MFILAIAVSPILVPRRHLWSQSDGLMLIDGVAVAFRIAIGTILTGCALLAYRRWQGDRSYPSRAGHWLLLRALAVHATWTISRPIYWLLLRALAVPVTQRNFNLYQAGVYVSVLIIDLAFLWCLRRGLPRHWVAVFLVHCLAAAIRAALLFMQRGAAMRRSPWTWICSASWPPSSMPSSSAGPSAGTGGPASPPTACTASGSRRRWPSTP